MQLLSILWQRYRSILLILVVLVCGLSILEASSSIDEWNNANTFMKSQKFKQSYAKDATKYTLENKKKQPTYQQFIKQRSQFWFSNKHDVNQVGYLNENTTRSEPADTLQISIGLCLFAVFFLLMSDITRHFNAFLLGSKNTRLNIIFGKYIMLGLLPILTVIVSEGLYYALINLFIPDQYLNWSLGLNLGEVLIELIVFLLLLALIFITSTIIGAPIWSFVLLLGLLVSLVSTTPLALTNIYNAITMSHLEKIKPDDLFSGPLSLIVIISIIMVLLIVEVHLFKNFSGEHDGQFVMQAKLRWPLWWTTLCYTSFSIGFGAIPSVVSNGMANEIMQMASWFSLIVIINLVMYILIFRPKSLKHPIKSIQ